MSYLRWLCVSGILSLLIFAQSTYAEKLQITSKPAGAAIEINGIPVGTTPFEREFPGGYFHKTKTAIGARLEHSLVARVTLPGYATKEITLSQGPMEWIGLNGRHHGEYWLLKAGSFDVDLDPIDEVFTGSILRVSRHASTDADDEPSLEDLITKTKPAVVYLSGADKSGTGFFVTQTGVIATNAHVARDEETLALALSGGVQIEAKVVYIDDELDIALAKVAGNGFTYLPLADTSTVRQGESVLAVGNPGDGMQFSVTKGIVSAVGPYPSVGRGTWIQTDAQINPGNSGGPLLNTRGEVIGINTQKVTKRGVTGISFALSAGDLLSVLRKFYHDDNALPLAAPLKKDDRSTSANPKSPGAPTTGFGTLVVPEPVGETVSIDGVIVGNVPASVPIRIGVRDITVTCRGHIPRTQRITVMEGSAISAFPVPWCTTTSQPGLKP